jgi:outer membrane protein TolC
MVASEKAQLEQAVTAGTTTRAQADQAEATLKQSVTARVNGSFGGGRPGGGRFGGGAPDGGPSVQTTPSLKGTV